MSFNIEITASPDVDRVATIHKACFTQGWSAHAIAELLAIKGTIAFCAGEKAFGLLRVLGDEAEILTLCVHPESRKQGLASAIIHAMIAYGKEQGVQKLFLEVREGNAAAITLYTNAGFALLSQRKHYYAMGSGNSEHALILCHTITT